MGFLADFNHGLRVGRVISQERTYGQLGQITAVRLKVEQNQLVGVFGEVGILFDALKGA